MPPSRSSPVAADSGSSSGSGSSMRSPSPGLRKRNPAEAEAVVSSKASAELSALKAELKAARRNTTLLRAPIQTITIFTQVLFGWLWQSVAFLFSHRLLSYSLLITAAASIAAVIVAGPESEYVFLARHSGWFVIWWVTLGVLSSVGLGTGLHTFVLYLGPYIAMVTLAVTECDTMNVPLEGADALVCPPVGTPKEAVTFLRILLKVLPACFLWGAGTAIGELPPYFVSRAARLSGQKLEELEELDEEERGVRVPSALDRVKLMLFHALQSWGFWAIVICASVPNPLFDLAGITCGHFLIPFWTFFGATFIGKALVKVQIQSAFVILAFDKNRLAWIIERIEKAVPAIAGRLGPIFEKQRQQFHSGKEGAQAKDSGSWIGFIWNSILIVMLLWFVKSIIESSVQERLADRDAATLEAWAAERGERVGVTTRLMSEKERLQQEAEAAAAKNSSSKKKQVR